MNKADRWPGGDRKRCEWYLRAGSAQGSGLQLEAVSGSEPANLHALSRFHPDGYSIIIVPIFQRRKLGEGLGPGSGGPQGRRRDWGSSLPPQSRPTAMWCGGYQHGLWSSPAWAQILVLVLNSHLVSLLLSPFHSFFICKMVTMIIVKSYHTEFLKIK